MKNYNSKIIDIIHFTVPVVILAVLLTGCQGIAYRDPEKCYVGQCLQENQNWSPCYKACTCGCWKDDSKGYYPGAVVAPNTVVVQEPTN